jgi:hypothetical protein
MTQIAVIDNEIKNPHRMDFCVLATAIQMPMKKTYNFIGKNAGIEK